MVFGHWDRFHKHLYHFLIGTDSCCKIYNQQSPTMADMYPVDMFACTRTWIPKNILGGLYKVSEGC